MEPTTWADFKRQFIWNQGEHVAIVGPTGAGKTTLVRELLPYRKASLILGTKIDDPQYHNLIKSGFKRVQTVRDIRPGEHKILLWPKQGKDILETEVIQKKAIREALNAVIRQKAWTVVFDEAKYISEHLGLKRELTFCLEQLRSIKSTIICGVQRPTWIPPSTLPNSTHVFIWKTTDINDARKLAEIGGVDAHDVRDVARSLDDFEFLYIRSRGTNTKIIRTQVKE